MKQVSGLETFFNGEETKLEMREVETLKKKKANVKVEVEDGFVLTPKGNKFPIAKKKRKRDTGKKLFVSQGLKRSERIMEQFPEVDKWLRTRYNARSTWGHYSCALIDFCIAKDITPKQFADLRHSDKEHDKAIDLASEYIQDLLFNKTYHKANQNIKALKSFYEFYSKGRRILALDTKGSLKIKIEDMRSEEKSRYAWGPSSEIRRKTALIIPSARDLFDRMALTFLFRTGCRRNVLTHLKIKDVQDRFQVKNTITGKNEEVLCLTITGYDPDTKEGICEKSQHYGFAKLPDDPQQRHGYYTFLAKDSLKLFDKFLEKYHANAKPEDYVFFRLSNRQKPICIVTFSRRFKTILKRLGFPEKKIWLHQFKELTTTLAESALSKEESYHVEFLTGHLLGQSKEHYHKRNKIADAQAYLKIDFTPIESEQVKKEINRLREEIENLKRTKENRMHNGDGELEELQNWEKQYLNDVKETETPKSEPIRHTKPIQKAKVVMEPTSGLRGCPYDDNWVAQVACDKCQKTRFQVWSDCYNLRQKAPNNRIFKPSKPKPKE